MHAASSGAARALVASVARGLECLTDAEIDDLCVAVGEAFANIIRHGACTHGDHVRLLVEHRSDRLVVQLAYRGEPFNTTPPCPEPDALSCGGYGLFIMRTLADRVEFEFAGGQTRLVMEKWCQPRASASSDKRARRGADRVPCPTPR